MLKSVTLENFFSFGKVTTIKLNAGVSLNVGINGSGKSNFLKAIRLLYEGVIGDLGFEKLFLGEWGGFSSVINNSLGEKKVISLKYIFDVTSLSSNERDLLHATGDIVYKIRVFQLGTTGYYLMEDLYELDSEGYGPCNTFLTRKNTNGSIVQLVNNNGDIVMQGLSNRLNHSSGELALKISQDPVEIATGIPFKETIERLATYDIFNTTSKSKIRSLTGFSVEPRLTQQGSNLAVLLQYLSNNHSLAYDLIETELKKVNPHFKSIGFSVFNNKTLLVLKESKLNKAISPEHISDGTLQYLLLLSIFYNPERGQLVFIDEPEIGLHPDMINAIAKGIKYAAANGTQMIINTHSPLLLNSFDVDDVFIYEKNKRNETVVKINGDENFPEIEDGVSVGQLWMMGKLGGTRWQ